LNPETEAVNKEDDNQDTTAIDNITIEMVDEDEKTRVDVAIEIVNEDDKTLVVISNPLDTCDKNNILV